MDTRDFVSLTLLAAGGRVEGKTKLQKLVYFVGILTGSLEELGYRPHFYGPYSDDVAYGITQLKAIGAIDQKVSDWGYDQSGFEVRRYDFFLNESGRSYATKIAYLNTDLWGRIRSAVEVYKQHGDRDYMSLSIAAKSYFLLRQKEAPATNDELAKLASQFGWTVSSEQVGEAVDYLVSLGLVKRVGEL